MERLEVTEANAYVAGRALARENRKNKNALLLLRQGLLDEIMSWDYREGQELLSRKVEGGKRNGKKKG